MLACDSFSNSLMTGKIRPINAGSKVEKELDHENLETKDLKEEYLE